MSNARVTSAATHAAVSIDMVRVIRRCMRCLILGLIGLVPIIGAGPAVQSLRLQRRISAELVEEWKVPRIYLYWLMGIPVLCAVDAGFGWVGDLAAGIVLLAVQSWHIWRSFGPDHKAIWNPGRPQMIQGTICAYAGLSVLLWIMGLVIYRVMQMSGGV